MANNVIGNAVIEIRADAKKLKSDMENIKKDVQNTGKKMETDFKALRLDLDNRLATMKISEVKKYYESLKIQMNQKLKFNTDESSIEKTAVAMDAARARMNSLGNEVEGSGNKMFAMFSKLGAVIASVFAIEKIIKFASEGVKLNAETEDLRESFEGTANDIMLMKKATSDMLDEHDLLQLSNEASAVNIKIKDQPILFLLASKAGKSMGKDVNAGFETIISATEGLSRGLRKLGIERGAFNDETKRLAALEGARLTELDAEEQKRIKIQAILNLSNLSMKDVLNSQASMNQQLKSIPSLVDELKESFGKLFDPLLKVWLPPTIEFLKDMGRRIKELAIGRGAMASENLIYVPSGKTQADVESDKLLYQTSGLKKISELQNLIYTRKKDNKDLTLAEYEYEKNLLELQISTYGKLYQLAKNYKVIEEKSEKSGGNLTPEALAARQEKQRVFLEKQRKAEQDLSAAKLSLIRIEAQQNEIEFIAAHQMKLQQIEDEKIVAIKAIKDELELKKINNKTAEDEILAIRYNAYVKYIEAKKAYDKQRTENKEFITNEFDSSKYSKIRTEEDAQRSSDIVMNSLNDIQDKEDKATKGAEQFSQTLSGGFGNAIMAGENLGDTLINITAQLAGAVLQAGLLAAIMSIVTGGKSSFGGFFVKALGFGAMTDNGTNISVPNINSNAVSSSFSMQNNFNDSNIVGEIKNLNNKINALANRPLISNFYMNRKLVGRSISLQQYQDTSSNVKVY